jgi:serine/threonine protein kinase
MLTGVHPFDLFGDASDEDIAEQILQRKLPPLRNSSITAHLSDDAISLIEQLLQWNPKKRLTADQVLNNRWVRGETARTDKMKNSDTRLSKYKAFKSKLAAQVFADMVSFSSKTEKLSNVDSRASLLEHAFQKLDESHKGYITTKDIQKRTNYSPSGTSTESGEDEQLSLSGFSGLMEETLKNRYFPKGHIIYNEGDKGDAMLVSRTFFLSIPGLKRCTNTFAIPKFAGSFSILGQSKYMRKMVFERYGIFLVIFLVRQL